MNLNISRIINKIFFVVLISITCISNVIAESIIIKNCKGEIIAKESKTDNINKILIKTDFSAQNPTLKKSDNTQTIKLVKGKNGHVSETLRPGEWVLCEENLTETKFSKILFLGENDNLTPALTVAGAVAAAVGIVVATDDNSSNTGTSSTLTQPSSQNITDGSSGSSAKPTAKPIHDDACDDTNTIISQSQLGCAGAPDPISASSFE